MRLGAPVPLDRDAAILGRQLTFDAAGRVRLPVRCEVDASAARCRGVLVIVGEEPPLEGRLLGLRRYTDPARRDAAPLPQGRA